MSITKRACFFCNQPREHLRKQQYCLQDIRILTDLGYEVEIATSFGEIPWGCDLYFSWWAAGSILPLVKAKLSDKPIIVVAGGNESMLYRDSVSGVARGYLVTPWYKKLAARLSLRFGTVILVVSRFMIDDVTKLGARLPIVVPNSVDTDIFCPSNDERTVVTTVFNLDETSVGIKRGEVFLRAAAIVLQGCPEQRFALIGKKSNAYQRMCDLVRQLGIQERVDFVGSIDNSEVARWLQKTKIYVQISDTETFGVAIAEAMSCGTPVVVSRSGAIPELVGEHGVFVDHNDAQSVAAGIIGLLAKTAAERDAIGTKMRARIVENYSYTQRKSAVRNIIAQMQVPGSSRH